MVNCDFARFFFMNSDLNILIFDWNIVKSVHIWFLRQKLVWTVEDLAYCREDRCYAKFKKHVIGRIFPENCNYVLNFLSTHAWQLLIQALMLLLSNSQKSISRFSFFFFYFGASSLFRWTQKSNSYDFKKVILSESRLLKWLSCSR